MPWITFLVIALSADKFPPDSGAKFLAYLVGNLIFFYAVYRSFPRIKRFWKVWKGKADLETITKPDGFFFGKEGKQDIGKPSSKDGHILIMGGAGSGKSSAIAIPTLRDYWQHRFLAVDIKGELAEKTGRNALIFNPLSPSAYGYDPFYLARQVSNPTPYIRDIALALVPLPPETKQPFFIQSAQNILTGHLLASLRHGDSFIESIEVIQSISAQVLIETDSQDELARRFLIQFLSYIGSKDETLGSIMAELANHIMPLATDPDIKAALSKPKTIHPYLLEQGNNIFIQIPEHRINQWKVLITLILQQFLTAFESRPEGSNSPILFLLDEFARFGKLEGVIHGLATLRSKKITICIIIQSLAQLDAIYGHEQRKIIADNCAYKAILSATDADTQRYFSSIVGIEERRQYSHSPQGTSFSYADKPIIRPEEFAYLRDIVLLTPQGYGRVTKAPYYLESKGYTSPQNTPRTL